MLVREYQESDLAQLRAIHAAQGFDYALPDLSNPLFITKQVLTRNDGAIVGAYPGWDEGQLEFDECSPSRLKG